MDFSIKWTQFAVEGEAEYHGVKRLVESHNKTMAEIARLKQSVEERQKALVAQVNIIRELEAKLEKQRDWKD